MTPAIWAKAHGATTHFPIALVLASAVFDAAGGVLAGRSVARELHAAGFWTMMVGAAGSIAAVGSGLLMTKGAILGHDALRMHHLFVWPAFGLLISVATWRTLAGRRMTRPMLGGYLLAVAVLAALITAAGYYGGELMMAR
ncbi:MAG TPA: DUF2231 domain-containing protein [Opitutus sp.]|nr:DUF2231 domain-containing protein [Opitutus sp.]